LFLRQIQQENGTLVAFHSAGHKLKRELKCEGGRGEEQDQKKHFFGTSQKKRKEKDRTSTPDQET
jgi:hypothetical protein